MDLLSVEEAAGLLNVRTSTIYAYVSRGILARAPQSKRKQTVFLREDIEALAARSNRAGRTGTALVPNAADISSIVADTLYYRGREATVLAAESSFERVAEFLWDGRADPRGDTPLDAAWTLSEPSVEVSAAEFPAGSLPVDRLKVAAALAGASDPLRYDLAPGSVRRVGRRVLASFACALPPVGEPVVGGSLADDFWCRLTSVPVEARHSRLLSNALVVLADHGPAPSTLAVGAAARVAADPYSVLLTGMGVASGLLHGGSSLAAQTLFGEAGTLARVPAVVGTYLRNSPRIPGFGQPRYRGPDPRARFILERLHEEAFDPERLAIVDAVLDTVRDRRDTDPNIEFALGALCFVYGMSYGAGEAIFVVARTAGWIAHAIEEYEALAAQGRVMGLI